MSPGERAAQIVLAGPPGAEPTTDAAVPLAELLKGFQPIPCGDAQSHKDGARPMLESRLGVIDQCRGGGIDAATYTCACGWRSERRLKPNGRG